MYLSWFLFSRFLDTFWLPLEICLFSFRLGILLAFLYLVHGHLCQAARNPSLSRCNPRTIGSAAPRSQITRCSAVATSVDYRLFALSLQEIAAASSSRMRAEWLQTERRPSLIANLRPLDPWMFSYIPKYLLELERSLTETLYAAPL